MERNVGRRCVSALACLLAIGTAIQAKTIHVGTGAAAEYPSIRAAVEAAGHGDVIVVEEGVYTGDANRDIVVAGKAVTIRSRDPNDPMVVARTVIDCQGTADAGHRAFEVRPGAADLTLEGLTISNGRYHMSGGAVHCEEARFRATNCDFAGHRVAWWGGTLYFRDSEASFEGCTFTNNVSDAGHGGAIFCMTSVLELNNCTFQANRGGAIESFDSSLTLALCIFQENTGGDGGAIHSRVDANPQIPSVLDLRRCSFTFNAAGGSGGALYHYEVNAAIDGCTFIANTAAKDGGAIFNYRASPVMTDCVLVSNTAAGLGGAVLSFVDSDPQIVNCTLVANQATRGGAVAGKGRARTLLSHSILWDNAASQGPNLYLAKYDWGAGQDASATVEYSNIAGGRNSVGKDPECVLTWSTGNIDAEPLFSGPAQDDYRLSPDSPCIDAGDPCYAPPAEATDLDNQPRQVGPAVDLGAYEFRGLGPVYRFRALNDGRQFLTIEGAERDKLIKESPPVWTYEDVAYYAYYQPLAENLLPVYRFWSPVLSVHFWTVDEGEKQGLVDEFSDVWSFEGIVFYVYPKDAPPLGTLPVYRFWSNVAGHHFYTMDETERDDLIENHADEWDFEGVAWYAYPKPQQLGKAAYAFTGGPDGAWYTMTLAATLDGKEAQLDAPDVTLVPAGTQMQMTIDSRELTVTLDRLSVQTETTEHQTSVALAGTEVTIPLTLSVEASFVLPTARGPYAVDPATGLFANFSHANQNFAGIDSVFSYRGSVSLAGQEIRFDRSLPTTRFELEAFGTLESLSLLPEGLYARMPVTFQWHRQQTRDLLVEGSVDGRRIQVYVVYSYVGTQGLWRGTLIE